ncbi:MAG: 50S ribosomal protein L10 [Patescibacteria group bacterium]|nr:50S ribosomal protein L10 [Patescibacteria group bacterium]
MVKTKKEKKKELESLKEKIKKQKTMIFVDFSGLKVENMSKLRRTLKKSDSELKVAKKTLMKLALKEAGMENDISGLKGEIALVFGYEDEIVPAKLVYEFSRGNPSLKILGGFFENQFKSAEDFIVLAQLSSRQELLARLVGSISSPIAGFVRVLEANLKGLVCVLSAIKKQ